MPPPVDEWIIVKDFSPGIKGRVSPANIGRTRQEVLGVASPSGTYRCQALPNGSLGPMPKRTYSLAPTLPIDPSTLTQERLTIAGFHVDGPIQTGVEFHLAYEGVKSADTRRAFYWQRIRNFDSDQIDTLFSANPTSQTSGVVATQCRPCWFHNWRANASDPTLPGLPIVVAGWFEGGGGSQRVWKMFPDPDTPTSNTPGDIATTLDPSHAFAHQGRAVILDQSSYAHGADSLQWTHNEDIYMTVSNGEDLESTDAFTLGMENATGYSAVVSTNYGELLLLKLAEGGLFVRGDLTDPTVLRIPGIPPLGNTRHAPTTSPVGVVFLGGQKNGAWLWNGGESAENISYEAIDGEDFILTAQGGSTDFLDYFGRLYYWQEWVLFPNNWVWNWREQSWWRIEDPTDAVLFHWGPSNGERIWAAPAHVVESGNAIYGFDRNVPADDYRWTSQPIPLYENKEFTIRDLVMVASGQGTLTVTLTNRAGTTEVHTVEINSTTTPSYTRENCAVDCEQLQYQIDADNDGTPLVVHELRFGISRRTSYPAAAI